MYSDGPLFWLQREDLEKAGVPGGSSSLGQVGTLLRARRQTLPRLHPKEHRGLGIADGPADLDVGRPVAAHAGFGQPRQADLQKPGRFLGPEKDDARRSRLLRARAAGERRL